MFRLALLLLALPTLALAQDDAAVPDRGALHQKTIEIDFDALDVNATLNRPGLQVAFEARRETFNPLIRLRTDFEAELAASVDDVK